MSRSREMPSWFGWFFVLAGLWMILLYLGVIQPTTAPRKRALLEGYSHWQVLCAGVAFAGLGITIAWEKTYPLVARVTALLGGACLLAVLAWVLFFSSAFDSLPTKLLGGFCLAMGIAGMIGGQLNYSRSPRKAIGPQNPVDVARVYWRYGRRAQAEAVLQQAAREQPEKARIYLDALEKLKASQ